MIEDYQNALDRIREHLTILHANPNIYEDGTCNVIQALEEFAIPALETQIPKKLIVKREFGSVYGREFYACPNPDCGEYVRYKYAHESVGYPNRCEFCGQVLDWYK